MNRKSNFWVYYIPLVQNILRAEQNTFIKLLDVLKSHGFEIKHENRLDDGFHYDTTELMWDYDTTEYVLERGDLHATVVRLLKGMRHPSHDRFPEIHFDLSVGDISVGPYQLLQNENFVFDEEHYLFGEHWVSKIEKVIDRELNPLTRTSVYKRV